MKKIELKFANLDANLFICRLKTFLISRILIITVKCGIIIWMKVVMNIITYKTAQTFYLKERKLWKQNPISRTNCLLMNKLLNNKHTGKLKAIRQLAQLPNICVHRSSYCIYIYSGNRIYVTHLSSPKGDTYAITTLKHHHLWRKTDSVLGVMQLICRRRHLSGRLISRFHCICILRHHQQEVEESHNDLYFTWPLVNSFFSFYVGCSTNTWKWSASC